MSLCCWHFGPQSGVGPLAAASSDSGAACFNPCHWQSLVEAGPSFQVGWGADLGALGASGTMGDGNGPSETLASPLLRLQPQEVEAVAWCRKSQQFMALRTTGSTQQH